MPIYLFENKTKKRKSLDFDRYESPLVQCNSDKIHDSASIKKGFQSRRNKNNNHSLFKTNYPTSSKNSSLSYEALAEVTDIECDFNYDLDDVSISSDEPKCEYIASKKNLNKETLPKPKWTKYESSQTNGSSEKQSTLKNLFLSNSLKENIKSKKKEPPLLPLPHKSRLDWCLMYKYIFRFVENVFKIRSFTRKEQKLFYLLLNLLLFLLFILFVFYYFLSVIFSSNVTSQVRIENENIYIKL